MLYKYTLFLAGVLACVSVHLKASEPSVDFSGFATLSMSYSDDSDIGFSSNYLNGSETGFSLVRDSILGAQANITVNNNWDAVVQAVYQDRSIKSFDSFLELAFVRYRPQRNWTIRAGRMSNDAYLLSEYSYVGYAYLWVRPPHAYYSFASAAGHYDGVDIEYSNQINDGFLRVKLAVGETVPKLSVRDEELSITFNDLYILSAIYLKDEWTFRASTARSKISDFKSDAFYTLIDSLNSAAQTDIWPLAGRFAYGFEPEHHIMNYSAFGLTYDNTDWVIQAEFSSTKSDWMVVPSNINGYFSAGYRVNEMTYFGGFSVAKNIKNKREALEPKFSPHLPDEVKIPVQELIAVTDYAVKRAMVDQKSINLGAKWDYSNQLVFKMQADHFMIEPRGSALWNVNSSADLEAGHDINVISFSASMVF